MSSDDTWWDGDEGQPAALGQVLEQGRGALPFALIHGEALVSAAAWALGDAGVMLVDLGTMWVGLADAAEPLVLHDPLCPMTPAWFIADCVAAAVEQDRIAVGVRPVTDTVKPVEHGLVGASLDRSALVSVASPVVLPARVVAALDDLPDLDFAVLVATLAQRFEVVQLQAPPSGRRVVDEADVRLLEALTRSG